MMGSRKSHLWASYDPVSAERDYRDGKTVAEIARDQGCSASTVRRRLADAGLTFDAFHFGVRAEDGHWHRACTPNRRLSRHGPNEDTDTADPDEVSCQRCRRTRAWLDAPSRAKHVAAIKGAFEAAAR